jgi:hypothetical protein
MDVPVEDEDPLEAVGVERALRGDRDVVEEAEPHRPSRVGVMTGRAVDRRAGRDLAAGQRVGQRRGPAGRVQRRLPGAGRGDGVDVDHAAALRAEALDAIHVQRVVHRLERLAGGRGRLAHVPAEPVARGEGLLDRDDARGALRMRAGVVLERGRVAQQERLRHPDTVPRRWRPPPM